MECRWSFEKLVKGIYPDHSIVLSVKTVIMSVFIDGCGDGKTNVDTDVVMELQFRRSEKFIEQLL